VLNQLIPHASLPSLHPEPWSVNTDTPRNQQRQLFPLNCIGIILFAAWILFVRQGLISVEGSSYTPVDEGLEERQKPSDDVE
jgi:hypothetical protein